MRKEDLIILFLGFLLIICILALVGFKMFFLEGGLIIVPIVIGLIILILGIVFGFPKLFPKSKFIKKIANSFKEILGWLAEFLVI